jgi:PTH1 family peptidyl-tRNA hydrolase
MRLIAGLGNPGKKYEKTRHNLGFMVLDALLQDLMPVEETAWKKNNKFNCLMAKIGELILAKPQTFMNSSGTAVAKIANFYKIEPENIWIIHDEIDLPLGKMKIVQARGAAGHKGVESIIKELGTEELVRFRLGVGRPGFDINEREAESYVLSPFGQGEKKKVRVLVKKTVKAIKYSLDRGSEKAMSRFN